MSGPGTVERRVDEASRLRLAIDELESCLARLRPGVGTADDGLRPQLRSCAESARQLALPPERFLVVLKRVLDRRPELHAELEVPGISQPRWTRRERLISWAIGEYYGGRPASEAERGRRAGLDRD